LIIESVVGIKFVACQVNLRLESRAFTVRVRDGV
jgi:hypothetical protein